MLKIILMIILVISGVYLAYFLILACGLFRKDKNKISNKKKNNFAVLIAARNEELVIGNLVKSLKKQKYPKENYEIFVIVNNCTDNTEKVAIEAGASIIECTEKVKSKGEVLKFAFNKLKDNKEIDAYVSYLKNEFPNKELASLTLKIDGEFVDMSYEFEEIPFERIRRITGYLVGTLDRFNNAKKAEEHDRVKHDVSYSML